MTAASASPARAEVLAWIDDPAIWRGELEAWNEAYYVERYGEPDDVVDVELGPGAFPSGYSVESACPVCRPGAVADGARPVRCILHGGDDTDVQPTNASASGFRLAGDGRGDGACAAVSAPGRDDAGAALERLAAAARITTAPGFEGRREIERDVATVRAALDDRAAAWRIAEAASEAAADMHRVAGFPMGGPEA